MIDSLHLLDVTTVFRFEQRSEYQRETKAVADPCCTDSEACYRPHGRAETGLSLNNALIHQSASQRLAQASLTTRAR